MQFIVEELSFASRVIRTLTGVLRTVTKYWFSTKTAFTHTAVNMMDRLCCAWVWRPAGMLICGTCFVKLVHGFVRLFARYTRIRGCAIGAFKFDIWC